MRLGAKSTDGFITSMGQETESIQKAFVARMAELVHTFKVSVMMGDSTVVQQETFEPKRVSEYLKGIVKTEGWSAQAVSVSNNEDIRRIFTKLEAAAGNYAISAHLSVQFHVLLYYKPDQRVLRYQRELSDLVDLTKDRERQVSDQSDQLVLDILKKRGYKDLDHQNLFEIFYENDNLREEIYGEIEKGMSGDVADASLRKKSLFVELDSMLVETYQTTPVLIDDMKMVAGEEGVLCSVDLEFVRGRSREGVFDPRKIPVPVKNELVGLLASLARAVGRDKKTL